jgi:polyhydroxyalkanoate synthesis regulator phasin
MVKKRLSGSKLRKKQTKNKGLFRPAKNKKIAEIIRMDSVKGVKHSISELKKLIDKGEITIDQAIKYVNCVANRAKVQERRKNLSAKEKREFKKIAKLYNDFKERLKKAKAILGLR